MPFFKISKYHFKFLHQLIFLVIFIGVINQNTAWGQLSVEGSGVDERPYTLGLPLIEGDNNEQQNDRLQAILIDDFKLSGLINPVQTTTVINPTQFQTSEWLAKGAEFLVVGKITPTKDGGGNLFRMEVNIRIIDLLRGVELQGLRVVYDSRQTAIVAHQIADAVIERITGVKVGLSQLIAFVVRNANGYDIRVSDIYGKNSYSVIRSRNPITSPTWSADGKKIAYSSFETGPARIFIQDIASGERFKIPSNFESDTAPAWSPDGNNIAFAAYSRGRTSIYEYNLVSNKIRVLVDDGSINTEPSYSGDGYLYYSSGRGRSPQIYRVNLSSLQSERVSFDEDYCIRPSSAIAKPVVAYLSQQGAKSTIVDNSTKKITHVKLPSNADGLAISPLGRLIMFSIAKGRNFNIIITNINGTYVKPVDIKDTNFYEPSWRP